MSIRLPRLGPEPEAPFPPAHRALREPDGLLAMGGDLHPQRLLNAYRAGIFPWYGEEQPILWWSPATRCVFDTATFRLSARTRRTLRKSAWQVTADRDFAAVIDTCAQIPRHEQAGTWITPDMRGAYIALHRAGHAHSIEVRDGERLVGGLYGVRIGRMFFAESMFSAVSGGSKAALAALAQRLAQWQWPLIDAQLDNPHLRLLGAHLLPRAQFLHALAPLVAANPEPAAFAAAFGVVAARELA